MSLTEEQRQRVEKLIPVYGSDPMAVGAEDGTEDDFGDLINETLEALGYRDEIDVPTYERVSEAAISSEATDIYEWATVLDRAALPREDWPVHQPDAPEAPIPGRHWYSGCDPDRPRVDPTTGICEGCGGRACPECGRENCPDHVAA